MENNEEDLKKIDDLIIKFEIVNFANRYVYSAFRILVTIMVLLYSIITLIFLVLKNKGILDSSDLILLGIFYILTFISAVVIQEVTHQNIYKGADTTLNRIKVISKIQENEEDE